MPDITMCKGKGCKKRESCYRYVAKPDRFQSYSAFEFLIVNGKCDWYWRCEDGDQGSGSRTSEII